MNNLSENYEKFIERIGGDTLKRDNTTNLIRMLEVWNDYSGSEIDTDFLKKQVEDFLTVTSHDIDTFIIYGFMLMKFFEYILKDENCPCRSDVEKAHENIEKSVLENDKETSIHYIRQLFGDVFPDNSEI